MANTSALLTCASTDDQRELENSTNYNAVVVRGAAYGLDSEQRCSCCNRGRCSCFVGGHGALQMRRRWSGRPTSPRNRTALRCCKSKRAFKAFWYRAQGFLGIPVRAVTVKFCRPGIESNRMFELTYVNANSPFACRHLARSAVCLRV